MPTTLASNDEYQLLAARLRILLPEEYQDSYESVKPISMGSAGLKYDQEGRVAWDEIWQTFCDLAMAGGPPHRGKLLAPATSAEIKLHRKRYAEVVAELCRGVQMVTGLAAMPSRVPGWVHVDCPSTSMAGWLTRAINMENVSAHVNGMVLHLPAGPHFRVEKESKNVIVSIAKTCHYWLGHTSVQQHRDIADIFNVMDGESPLIQPPFSPRGAVAASAERLRNQVASGIASLTGLQPSAASYAGWLGLECLTVPAALWMMRMLVAGNTLARREHTVLFVPINPTTDRTGKRVANLVARVHRLAQAQHVF